GLDQDRIAVGGFSAGGNLAASAALQARDLGSFEPACQLLAVPSLDVAEDPALKTSPLTSPMIGPGLLNLVRRTYFRDVDARRSPYASPLRATSLEGVAPAVVITGEYDVLRAEGDAYAARLAQDGVDVVHEVVPGADHYFLETGRARARTTLDLVVAQLRRHLGVTAWQSD
ncbi:MAG: alpha/beta hydrolase fold domain-containing protein, partial [Marmoricola sp.]